MADAGLNQIKVESGEAAQGVWELKIDGSLDWSNFAKVETAIEAIFKKNVYRVIVNLKGCKYISSAGFGCFISSLDTAMKNNGDLVFASTPPEIQDVFNILGLSKILHFAADTAAALAHFRK
jgi:anti-anti-sigma factor